MTQERADGTIEFRFYRPHVSQLYLVGDFNAWHMRNVPLLPDASGWWVCRLRLTPGTHRFRYYGDGQWFTDYAAFGLEPGPFGWNSVIEIRGDSSRSAA